jgi:hypothetical protein
MENDDPEPNSLHDTGDPGNAESSIDPSAGPEPALLTGASRTRKRFPLAALLAGTVLGCLAALLVFVAITIARGTSLPPLTRAAYEAAERRWKSHGPKSYSIDIEFLSGRMLAAQLPTAKSENHGAEADRNRIHVEVRDGEVTAMTRGGVTPRQRRTWEYWTVPGQLDTIEQELDMAAEPAAGFHAPAGSLVVQRAEFDPEYGYAVHYRRIVLGTDLEIEWQVTQFKVMP